jgi:hypothetical protein
MSRTKPNRTRKNAHIIYLSDEEEAAVKLRMERVRIQSFSKYSRKMMIDGYVLVIDDSKELKEFTLEINKIGVNINQIAHALNSGDSIPKETIDQLKDWMVTIWQYQRYILSGTPF